MNESMIAQMFWANQRVIDWLSSTPQATPAMLRLASHVLNTERIWIHRVRRLEQDPDRFKILDAQSMRDTNQANHDDLSLLIQGDLATEFDYQMFNGQPFRINLSAVILHLFSHGFHHRAQIATLATNASLEFPGVSYFEYTQSK